jgi:hypothetical protein
MIYPHARTLALETSSIPAFGRTLFLLSVWLDDVDAAESIEGACNYVFKPRFRHLPPPVLREPFRISPMVTCQPATVVGVIWEANPQTRASTLANDDRDLGLIYLGFIPNCGSVYLL